MINICVQLAPHARRHTQLGGRGCIGTQRSQVYEMGSRAHACGKAASRVNISWHITIGGERSAVELFIKMVPRTYETRKQVVGEDADVERLEES